MNAPTRKIALWLALILLMFALKVAWSEYRQDLHDRRQKAERRAMFHEISTGMQQKSLRDSEVFLQQMKAAQSPLVEQR